MIDFLGLTDEEIKAWFEEHGQSAFRGNQVLNWIYQKKVTNWNEMTNLGLELRLFLEENFQVAALELKKVIESKDQETMKFLWKLADGALVESVLIYSGDRRTVCVSSQIGCPARCAFCASGKQGLMRNLNAGEIVAQVYQIDRWLNKRGERVSHVVFMGMGEPFENYDAVLKSVRLLSDSKRLNLSQRRLTISTVGVVSGIKRLSEENLKVNLVLSLHAPNQRIRQKIIPYARKYSLDEILSSMLEFARKTGRDITYEYTLIAGINDKAEHAEELVSLLRGQQCTVNLIPYNPVEGLKLRRPEKDAIVTFREVLEGAGIVTTWRYTKGKDIAAACGQLALHSS